jgi:hypothetical protein
VNRPSTAREALIVEALGDLAGLLDRVEASTSKMQEARQAMTVTGALLLDRLAAFETGMSSIEQRARTKAVEHIIHRTSEAARHSIDLQTRAMSDAARTAFRTQVDATLTRLTGSLQRIARQADRPWDLWLTHAATAASSAVVTLLIAWWFASR